MGKSSIRDNLALLHHNISNNDIRKKKSSKKNTTYNDLHMYVSIAGMRIRKQLILENSISQDDKQALPSILEYLKEVILFFE